MTPKEVFVKNNLQQGTVEFKQKVINGKEHIVYEKSLLGNAVSVRIVERDDNGDVIRFREDQYKDEIHSFREETYHRTPNEIKRVRNEDGVVTTLIQLFDDEGRIVYDDDTERKISFEYQKKASTLTITKKTHQPFLDKDGTNMVRYSVNEKVCDFYGNLPNRIKDFNGFETWYVYKQQENNTIMVHQEDDDDNIKMYLIDANYPFDNESSEYPKPLKSKTMVFMKTKKMEVFYENGHGVRILKFNDDGTEKSEFLNTYDNDKLTQRIRNYKNGRESYTEFFEYDSEGRMVKCYNNLNENSTTKTFVKRDNVLIEKVDIVFGESKITDEKEYHHDEYGNVTFMKNDKGECYWYSYVY